MQQVEQNLNFDFAMTGEDGKELEPMFGPGLTGMRNLGNRCASSASQHVMHANLTSDPHSCYMASSLQSIFSLPTFQTRYSTAFFLHTPNCGSSSPATCFECQMAKVADGLLSGRYSVPRVPDEVDAGFSPSPDAPETKAPIAFQEGIKPSMFKALVGKDHADFSTMKQQDAGEFLLHLFELVRRSALAQGEIDPTKIFTFAFEERLQCTGCKGVRYKAADGEFLPLSIVATEKKSEAMVVEGEEKKVEYLPVELLSCLEAFTSPADVDYKCPACDSTAAIK